MLQQTPAFLRKLRPEFLLLLGYALLLFLLPGPDVGFARGLPLNLRLEFPFFAILALAAFALPSSVPLVRRHARSLGILLAILSLAKVCLWRLEPEQGLRCWIYSGSNSGTDFERAIPYRHFDGTHVDRNVDFTQSEFSPQGQPIDLNFLNNKRRFDEWDAQGNTDRRAFQFRAVWEGTVYVPSHAKIEFVLNSNHPSNLRWDGKEVLAIENVDPSQATLAVAQAQVEVKKGPHPLRVEFKKGEFPYYRIALQWRINDGPLTPIPDSAIFLNQIDRAEFRFAGVIQTLGIGWLIIAGLLSIVLVLGSLLASPNKDRARFAFGLFLIVAPLFQFAGKLDTIPSLERQVLSRGDDWLAYESQAINLLLGNRHAELLDSAYYYMPLYRYCVAFTHLLGGPGTEAVILGQAILYGLWLFLFFAYLHLLLGTAWMAGLVVTIFWAWNPIWVDVLRILPTIFGLFFATAFYFLLALYLRKLQTAYLIGAGIALGVTMGIRSEFLACLGIVLVAFLLYDWPNWKRALAQSSVLILTTLAVISPITFRNYLASGKFILLSEESHKSFQLETPVGLNVGTHGDRAIYRMFPPLEFYRPHVEYILQRPLAFAGDVVAPRALHIFGIRIDWPFRPRMLNRDHFLISVLGMVGFFGMWLRYPSRELYFTGLILFGYLGLFSVLGGLTYGWRILVPFYPLFISNFALFVKAWVWDPKGLRWRLPNLETIQRQPS